MALNVSVNFGSILSLEPPQNKVFSNKKRVSCVPGTLLFSNLLFDFHSLDDLGICVVV